MNVDHLIPVIPFHEEIISCGEGTYIYDTEGKKYLDVNSGQFCTILGHSNEELAECISNITKTIAHTNTAMLSKEVIEAAKQLNRISGEMDASSILLSTGAEAVEFAIRYAKHITGKEGLLCFDKGYHGLTLGAQSVTFEGKYAMPIVEKIYSASVPDTFATEEEVDTCIDEIKATIESNNTVIAAVLMEPVVSVGGMIFPTARYFEGVKKICEDNNVLLIFDESQTGYGRTGKWFAYQKMNVIPDMVVCAKGIGMGYPVSAVLMAKKHIPEKGFSMSHYSSHQNDAFSAAIVNFGIQYIEKNNILAEAEKKGEYLLKRFLELAKENKKISKPRGNGLMVGFELNIAGVENYRTIYPKFCKLAAEEGLIVQATNGGQTIRFLPSYLISYEEIDFCVHVIDKVLNKL